MTASPELAVARTHSLDDVIDDRHVIVCTGAGGVGKTTAAAALAIEAARRGRRTIVLTIDPARRLAQSLGLSRLDTSPRPVPGVEGLDAMMLDMKRTFDEVVERHATSPDRVQRILDNRFYQQLSASLAGTQEYMAMEKLYDLHQTGRYDCIVIDTPPTRNALDFLDAPRRLTDFLEGRFLKMFLSPGIAAGRFATRAVGIGTGLFMRAASRVTGATVLDDLAEFFQSFEGMYEGFKQRAQAVYHLLQRPDSAFVVISSPEPPSLREAGYFLRRLARDGMPTAGVVVNRVTFLPGGRVGTLPSAGLVDAAASLDPDDDVERATGVLLELALEARAVVARQQQAIEAAFHGLAPPRLVEVPLAGDDVHDVDSLRWVAARLVGADDTRVPPAGSPVRVFPAKASRPAMPTGQAHLVESTRTRSLVDSRRTGAGTHHLVKCGGVSATSAIGAVHARAFHFCRSSLRTADVVCACGDRGHSS